MLFFFLLIACITSCQTTPVQPKPSLVKNIEPDLTKYNYAWKEDYKTENAFLNQVQPPENFKRIAADKNSFADWLRHIPLKETNEVYLYNGNLKYNQTAQYRVIDIDRGNKDLQQCADAVMRLRAEYLFANNKPEMIQFNYNVPGTADWGKWKDGFRPQLVNNRFVWNKTQAVNTSHTNFMSYMEHVFNWCGTLSLEKQTQQISWKEATAGDILIKGGSPGHAVIIVDAATNDKGQKALVFAQSYMPAQDVHVLRNAVNNKLSPWVFVDENTELIETPEWTFSSNQFRRF